MAKERLKVMIDMDDTIVSSQLRIREMYQSEFGGELPSELLVWNGCDQLHKAPKGWIESAFNSKEFFNGLQIFPNVEDILKELNTMDCFDIYLATIGLPLNIQCKVDYMQDTGLSKYFKDLIFCMKTGNGVSMGKSFLAHESVMIDDHAKNLTHCKYPILFWNGSFKQWNNGYEGMAMNGWDEYSVPMLESIYKQYTHKRRFVL